MTIQQLLNGQKVLFSFGPARIVMDMDEERNVAIIRYRHYIFSEREKNKAKKVYFTSLFAKVLGG